MMNLTRPDYKSEKWLTAQGWTPGLGLGKDLQGRADYIKVSKKEDVVGGLGKPAYNTFDFSHWDSLYNEASKNITINDNEEGVVIEQKPVEKKVASPYANMFVKASEAAQTMKSTVNEEDLFRLCGKRELRMITQKGKTERLKAFENGTFKYVEPSRNASLPASPVESVSEKKKEKKRRRSTKKKSRKSSKSDDKSDLTTAKESSAKRERRKSAKKAKKAAETTDISPQVEESSTKKDEEEKPKKKEKEKKKKKNRRAKKRRRDETEERADGPPSKKSRRA
eukprot:TRINITY_DN12424_c0_g1_i1.p1 TRINITY_DN12424_c0_g1~~TRINITY_DN12424_c0_g1_i1.p1  ORF type:complete len:281 (+),score=106.17 TRINITY_DN12424_c0_g1_i1:41-883(+)